MATTFSRSVLVLLLVSAVVAFSATSAGSGTPRPATTSPPVGMITRARGGVARRLLLRGGAGRVSVELDAPPAASVELPSGRRALRRRAPPSPPLPSPPPPPPTTCPAYCQQPADSSLKKFSHLPLAERLRTAAAFLGPAIFVMITVAVVVHCCGRRATRSAVTAAVAAARQRAKQEAKEEEKKSLEHEKKTVRRLRRQILAKNNEIEELGESSRRIGRDLVDTGSTSGGPDLEELADDLKKANRDKETMEGLLLKEIEKRQSVELLVRELEAAARIE